MFRKENGVTLVALIITIIVLLILAGVTIAMVAGDNGILSYAETASEDYSEAEIRSLVATAANTAKTKELADKYDGGTTTATYTITDVRNEVIAIVMDDTTVGTVSGTSFTITSGAEEYTVTMSDGVVTVIK